jgi:hypothetical protein
MIRVKWCAECGRLGAFNFSYCPWCGHEFAEKPDGEAALAGAFDRLEGRLAEKAPDRLDLLERHMAELERDLGDFIEQSRVGDMSDDEAIPISDHLPGGP